MAAILPAQQAHPQHMPLQNVMQDPGNAMMDQFSFQMVPAQPIQHVQGQFPPQAVVGSDVGQQALHPNPQGMPVTGIPPGIPPIPNPVQAGPQGVPPPPSEEPEPQGVPQEVIDRDCKIMTFAEAMAEESERAFAAESGEGDVEEDKENAKADGAGYEESDESEHGTGKVSEDDPESFLFTEEDVDEDCEHEPKCGCAVKPKNKAVYIQGLQEDADDEPTCEVCQCGYEESDEVMVLPCNHFYHKECITKWLSMKTTCPKCRYEVSPPPPQREVIITRTTTIEWMPVTQWVPASTTTVEVRSEVGSEFETVTTTTTRPVMMQVTQPAGAPPPQGAQQLPHIPGPPPPQLPGQHVGHQLPPPGQPPAGPPQLPPHQQQMMPPPAPPHQQQMMPPPAPNQGMMAPAPGQQMMPNQPLSQPMIPAPGQPQQMLEFAAPSQQMMAPAPSHQMVEFAPAPNQQMVEFAPAPAPNPQMMDYTPSHPQPMMEFAAPTSQPMMEFAAPPSQPMMEFAPPPSQPMMEFAAPTSQPLMQNVTGPMPSPRRVHHRRGQSGGGEVAMVLSPEDFHRIVDQQQLLQAPPPPQLPMRQTHPPPPTASAPSPRGVPMSVPVYPPRPSSGSWQAMMGSSAQQLLSSSPPHGPTSRIALSSLGPPSPTIQPGVGGPPPPHTPPLMPGGPVSWAIPTMEAQASAVFAQGSQRFLQL